MTHKLLTLLQTLFQLHVAKWCHLDVSPGNVMLQWHSDHPWDTLRLVDFGFAKHFEAGTFCHGHNCLEIKVTFVHLSQLLSRQLLVFKTTLQSVSVHCDRKACGSIICARDFQGDDTLP